MISDGLDGKPVALFVMGLGRSGTSALTRVLALCGGTLPAELSHANADNPRGFWEPRAAVDLNEAILHRHGSRWFDPSLRLQEEGEFGAEERAVCISEIRAFLSTLPTAPVVVIKDLQITALSGLWFEAARMTGFDIAAVLAVRHPHEIFPSLQKHIGASPELSGALWVKYSLLAEKHTRGLPRVFVDYANLLDNWRREIKRISAALLIDLNAPDEGAVEEFLTPDLRHQQHCGPVTELFGTDWMSTVYEAQRAATRDEPWDVSALDRVFEAYRLTERSFRTAFDDFRNHFNATAVRSTASAEAQRSARDRDLLLAAVERNPEDAGSVLWLAECYFALGDFANARNWYERRSEMDGWDQEVFYAMYRVAEAMAQLGGPWPDVQNAYLRAWAFRPTRAEPLYAIAVRYRVEQHYDLGYLFAQHAAQIRLPEEDTFFVYPYLYTWCVTDELAICASQIGKLAEAFALNRRLLASPDLPDGQRPRITVNRDASVPAMLEAASSYPDALVGNLIAGPRGPEVTISLITGPDRMATEQTLNSFLHCCIDITRAGRFLVFDTGLPAADRAALQQRYAFLEFIDHPPGAPLAQIREQIPGRFWLHLGRGWRFFAPDDYITRLSAVLNAETHVFQVGINLTDADKPTGTCAAEQTVRRARDTGRYVLTDTVASGPAMFDTARLDQAGGLDRTDIHAIAELGLHTATLDEVLCIATT